MSERVQKTSENVSLEGGGAYEVDPSKAGTGVVIEVFDMEQGDVSAIVRASPTEWDAFVAKGDLAIGRVSNDRCADIAMAYHRAYMRGKISYTSKVLGRRESFKIAVKREAERMLREQGATVPRAAVEALRARLAECEDQRGDGIDPNERFAFAQAIRVALREIEALLGTTRTEKG